MLEIITVNTFSYALLFFLLLIIMSLYRTNIYKEKTEILAQNCKKGTTLKEIIKYLVFIFK